MRSIFVLLILVFSVFTTIQAQLDLQPQCGASSTIYELSELDGASAALEQSGSSSTMLFCQSDGVVDDPNWLSFEVDPYFRYSVQVTFENCSPGQNGQTGGQIGIYDNCDDWSNPIYCHVEGINGTHTILEDVIFESGTTYYLLLDGFQGSLCEVSFQVERYFPMESVTDWYHFSGGFGGSSTYWYQDIGDTLINNLAYRVIGVDTNPLIKRYIRENQQSRKVYTYNEFSNQEQLLYDFSATLGDVISYSTGMYQVTNIDEVESVYGLLKRWQLDGPGPPIYVIEGIGSADLFLGNTASDPTYGLLCAYHQNDKIYGNEDCSPPSRWEVTTVEVDVNICDGETYTFNSNSYSETGSYLDTLTTTSGQDSFVQTNLTILPVSVSDQNISLCDGDSIVIAGSVYDQNNPTGTIVLAGGATNGCDSIVNVSLSFEEALTSTNSFTACDGEVIVVDGTTYSESGTYEIRYQIASGCDSVATLVMEFLPTVFTADTVFICPGDSTIIDGNPVFEEGFYTTLYEGVNGCDSTHYRLVAFNQPSDCTTSTLESQSFGLDVSPNPFNDYVMINSEVPIDQLTITNIYGSTAEVIRNINQSQYLYDGSRLAAGVYLLSVSSDHRIESRKIVKY